MSIVESIIEFESGTLSDAGTLNLFGELIRTGQAWELQGSYGRTAASLIEEGLIEKDGTVNWEHYYDSIGG
jgi:hypothetical protein